MPHHLPEPAVDALESDGTFSEGYVNPVLTRRALTTTIQL